MERIANNIFQDFVYDECLRRNGSLKIAMLQYYDTIIRSKTAMDKTAYIEARQIIALNWRSISEFIFEIAKISKISIKSLIKLFNNPYIVKIFNMVGWSLKTMYDEIKHGLDYWKNLIDLIAEFVADTKIVKFSREKIGMLDEWLKKHPKARKFGGYAVATMLLSAWFIMGFTGDIDWDLDNGEIISAFSGSYSLSDLLASSSGIKFIAAVVAGAAFNLSIPYYGPTAAHFVLSLVYTLSKKYNITLNTVKNEDELEEEMVELKTN